MLTRYVMPGLVMLTLLFASQTSSQEKQRAPGEGRSTVDKSKQIPKVTADKPMSFWMAAKLDHSKAMLESLAKGDFEKLAEDAEQMRLLGKIEGFVRRKSEDYQTQLHVFDAANTELVRQAKRKNVEGAALAFNQLTTSCVACHVMLREGVQ